MHGLARTKWLKALKLLGQLFDVETPQQAEDAAGVKASCMVNLALCSQRENNLTEAHSWCTKALKCVTPEATCLIPHDHH